MIRRIAREVLPPFVVRVFRRLRAHPPTAGWHEIRGGTLRGRKMFLDPRLSDGFVDGTYDQFFSDYLRTLDLTGKVVFEIGAHVGYHAMNFASAVGSAGAVHAFEPNEFNRERMARNLSANTDLAERITVHDVAVSDTVGEIEFNFSPRVDDGTSSGSFIGGAHTPFEASMYSDLGFKKSVVRTVPIDRFREVLGIAQVPYLIKIDVEGAENAVLDGALNTITTQRPIVLMEIHSIYNMLKTCEFFQGAGYSINLLKEEQDGRCFIAATHRG